MSPVFTTTFLWKILSFQEIQKVRKTKVYHSKCISWNRQLVLHCEIEAFRKVMQHKGTDRHGRDECNGGQLRLVTVNCRLTMQYTPRMNMSIYSLSILNGRNNLTFCTRFPKCFRKGCYIKIRSRLCRWQTHTAMTEHNCDNTLPHPHPPQFYIQTSFVFDMSFIVTTWTDGEVTVGNRIFCSLNCHPTGFHSQIGLTVCFLPTEIWQSESVRVCCKLNLCFSLVSARWLLGISS